MGEVGNSNSIPISSDSGNESKMGSSNRVSMEWGEPEKTEVETEVVNNIRSRLRPRIKMEEMSMVKTPQKIKTVVEKIEKTSLRERKKDSGVSSVGKRQRRFSENSEKPLLIGSPGVGKKIRVQRRRRTTGL